MPQYIRITHIPTVTEYYLILSLEQIVFYKKKELIFKTKAPKAD